MAFLSYSEIKKLAQGLDEGQIIKSASASVQSKLVFLSHSSLDAVHLAGVIKFFEKFNALVYVDAGDKRLPGVPSPETAQILRDTICLCPRFVVMVSPNSKESRWIPWELGLADGFKGVAPVALLPISPTFIEENWAKQEYLGLYPRIVYGGLNGYSSYIWKVYDPRDDKSWPLENWLHKYIE